MSCGPGARLLLGPRRGHVERQRTRDISPVTFYRIATFHSATADRAPFVVLPTSERVVDVTGGEGTARGGRNAHAGAPSGAPLRCRATGAGVSVVHSAANTAGVRIPSAL